MKSPQENRQADLFRVELARIVNFSHGLVKLAKMVDWARFDGLFREAPL